MFSGFSDLSRRDNYEAGQGWVKGWDKVPVFLPSLYFIIFIIYFFLVVLTSSPNNEAELQLYRVMQRASLLAYYDTLLEMGKKNCYLSHVSAKKNSSMKQRKTSQLTIIVQLQVEHVFWRV